MSGAPQEQDDGMSGIFTTTLRLNLENADDRRAWEYLRNMDRTRYRSYSSAIVTAINDHFSRQERLSNDPFLETRERQEAFLNEIKDTIRESLQTSGVGLSGLAALLQSIQPAPQTEEAMRAHLFTTSPRTGDDTPPLSGSCAPRESPIGAFSGGANNASRHRRRNRRSHSHVNACCLQKPATGSFSQFTGDEGQETED